MLMSAAVASAAEFPLKEGDVWVMAGDSITAQHLHSNYFEAFCYARYPKLNFKFRNSGVGGDTIPRVLDRFAFDVAAWKPTVVSVELGMNDAGSFKADAFIENMGTLVATIRKAGARPVILSASPVNDGTTIAKMAGYNAKLDEYAKALKMFCEKEKIPYADQFHPLVDVWGKNKPNEALVNDFAVVRRMAADSKLKGVEHLKAFVDLHPVYISMQGDPVHPGPTGQLMMAAALLKELGAEPFVSSVTIARGKVEAKGCEVTNMNGEGQSIEFDRLDECLPFPIPANAREVLPLAPEVLELSQYLLTVKDLPKGNYTLKINDVICASLSSEQLAEGVNLTDLPGQPANNDKNPIAVQAQKLLDAVTFKENNVQGWRGLSRQVHSNGGRKGGKDPMATLTARVEAADAKIRDAAKPQKLHFEIREKR